MLSKSVLPKMTQSSASTSSYSRMLFSLVAALALVSLSQGIPLGQAQTNQAQVPPPQREVSRAESISSKALPSAVNATLHAPAAVISTAADGFRAPRYLINRPNLMQIGPSTRLES